MQKLWQDFWHFVFRGEGGGKIFCKPKGKQCASACWNCLWRELMLIISINKLIKKHNKIMVFHFNVQLNWIIFNCWVKLLLPNIWKFESYSYISFSFFSRFYVCMDTGIIMFLVIFIFYHNYYALKENIWIPFFIAFISELYHKIY